MAGPIARLWHAIFDKRQTAEIPYPARERIPFSPRSLAGVTVTPDTAITLSTVWACLRFISQTTAVLPWHVMRETERGGQISKSHPVDWLIYKRPNDEWTSLQFRETLAHWALRWGNGYAEIERDALGRPAALWPIHPERVLPERVDGRLVYRVGNGLYGGYSYGDSPAGVVLEASDMFHIRGFGEGPVGVNVVHYAAESLGWARAAQLFGAAFFGNGAHFGGVIKNKHPLTPEGLRRQKAEFRAKNNGVRRAFEWYHLDNDADIQPITVEPDKGQFIQTNQHLIYEICRWFGVPPHKVFELTRSTNNNIEHQAIEAVVDSISPWARRFEDEADIKLFGQNRGAYYTKMNMLALMRGDSASRAQYFQIMRNIGAYSVNDILRLDDMNTLGAEGDLHVMQGQYVPLDQIGKQSSSMPGEDPKRIAPPPAERGAQAQILAMAAEEAEHVLA